MPRIGDSAANTGGNSTWGLSQAPLVVAGNSTEGEGREPTCDRRGDLVVWGGGVQLGSIAKPMNDTELVCAQAGTPGPSLGLIGAGPYHSVTLARSRRREQFLGWESQDQPVRLAPGIRDRKRCQHPVG